MLFINYYFRYLLVFSCILAITFAACNTSEQKSDKRFFRYNQASGITSLDPAFAKDQANIWAINQLYTTLVQMDDELNINPYLAERWDIVDSGLTYLFYLRDDVFFHDHEKFPEGKGRKVTAHDVAYSLNRLIDKEIASPGAWLFNDKVADSEPFKAVNNKVFQMKLKQAFRPMLGILSMQYCSVVPKEIVEHYGKEFRINPVGSGPFQFKLWKENEALVLEKNQDYFEMNGEGERLPLVDGVKISFIENKRNAYLKFIEGDLDLLSGIDPTYKDDLVSGDGELKSELEEKIKLLRSPYLNTEYLGFLMTDKQVKPLQDKRVRQAINYGFDRVKMIQFLRNNIGIPATSGFVPQGLPSFDAKKVKGYSHNPSKARALLKEAGYENGKGLSEITLETTSSYKDLCTYIQNQLAEIGVKVKLELNPPSFLREKMAKGESSFFRASWIGDYPDSETYLTVLYGGNPAPPNYTQFKNENYDKLYRQALLENDDAARFALYQEMDKILIEEAPIIPLYYDEVLRFVQKDVEQLGVNAFNLLTLKNIRFKK